MVFRQCLRDTKASSYRGFVEQHKTPPGPTRRCFREFSQKILKKSFEDSPAALPLGLLCDDHGFTYIWGPDQSRILKKGSLVEVIKENAVVNDNDVSGEQMAKDDHLTLQTK